MLGFEITTDRLQAGSAIAVVLFTCGLLVATFSYVHWTKRMVNEIARGNDLQRDANQITAAGLAIAQGQASPSLLAHTDGSMANAESVTVPLVVANLGGGSAAEVVVVTDWGEALVRDLIPGGGEQRTQVVMERSAWDARPKADQDPRIISFRFRDATGVTHEQLAAN